MNLIELLQKAEQYRQYAPIVVESLVILAVFISVVYLVFLCYRWQIEYKWSK